jgi:hypothetical protein
VVEIILGQFVKREYRNFLTFYFSQTANKLVIKVLETLNETKLPQSTIGSANPVFKSPYAHLVKLMPTLCKCIPCSDVAVRELVAKLMEKIASEINS